MRTHARAIVIGGGIAGCSLLYHLTKLGWKDVVLLEKNVLTAGSTWHSAGLCTMFSGSLRLMKLLRYSVGLYQRLEGETGQHVGFKPVGSLRLATSQGYVDWFRHVGAIAQSAGIPFELVDKGEAAMLSPLIREDGILCAAVMPADGYVDPSGVTQALAKGARQAGAEIYENTRVKEINLLPSGEWRVVSDRGAVTGDVVVNAAGQWAREVGRLVGVELPIVPVQHQYVVLEGGDAVEGVLDEFPVTRDPERSFYMRKEGEGLLVGFFERGARPWGVEGIPSNFGQQLLNPDFGQIEGSFSSAIQRVPALEGLGVARIVNGPDAYTPDGMCIMGEVPGLRGFNVLAGFSCFGIVFSGGAGRHAAEWIVEGRPSEDMWELDVRRFGPYATAQRYLVARACETYEREYSVHYPHEERPAGRPLRTSAIYDRLKARGAVYGARFGWERPLWFAPSGVEPADTYTFRRPTWLEHVGRECKTVRERVGLLDQTSFGKIEVSGPSCEALLDRLCANRVPRQKGKVVVTQMLNKHGGIECDLTVTRLEGDSFLIITAAATTEHDLDWIRRSLSGGQGVNVRDVTAEYGCLTISGPLARQVVERASDDDVSNRGFPYMTMKRIRIGSAPVCAIRISYVGELGWELYHPIEMQRHLYETLVEAGREWGIVDYGYRALDSLRMEKGYRLWGFDMTGQHTPYEAGLARFVCLDKGDFVGREALERQRSSGVSRSLTCLTLDDPPAIPQGWEPIMLVGEVLGHVTSGEYGHCVQKAIFMAYLPPQYTAKGTNLEVEILGERLPATVVEMPIYDAGNEKPRQ